ncbi:MAG: pantetheine-phosphate adenylyltransferase [Bacteroidota bacterium]|nr:pantetheine-phosphate adenylyltransferase [Bacteroidota bacterium]
MKIAVFPGSFDPITLGHCDIVKRSLNLFDKVLIAVGTNSEKKYMFPLDKRMEFVKNTFEKIGSIEIESFKGLTIDFCKKKNADFIIRGVRNPGDFEFEKTIALTNRKLSGIETVFLLTSPSTSYISSSIVREIIAHNGDYKHLVPNNVIL